MDLGSLELQIFVSLTVVLGAAFVALVCDYLKGNNEQLREHNIELRVRKEEQERQLLLDPAGYLAQQQFQPAVLPAQMPIAARAAVAPRDVMRSHASTGELAAAEARAEALQSRMQDTSDVAEIPEMGPRRQRRNRRNSGAQPNATGETFGDWVRPETIARVARKADATASYQSDVREEIAAPKEDARPQPLNAADKWDIRDKIAPQSKHSVPPPAVEDQELIPEQAPPAVEKSGLQKEIEHVAQMERAAVPAINPNVIFRPLVVPSLSLEEELERLTATEMAPLAKSGPIHSALLEQVIAVSSGRGESVAEKIAAIEPDAIVAEPANEILPGPIAADPSVVVEFAESLPDPSVSELPVVVELPEPAFAEALPETVAALTSAVAVEVSDPAYAAVEFVDAVPESSVSELSVVAELPEPAFVESLPEAVAVQPSEVAEEVLEPAYAGVEFVDAVPESSVSELSVVAELPAPAFVESLPEAVGAQPSEVAEYALEPAHAGVEFVDAVPEPSVSEIPAVVEIPEPVFAESLLDPILTPPGLDEIAGPPIQGLVSQVCLTATPSASLAIGSAGLHEPVAPPISVEIPAPVTAPDATQILSSFVTESTGAFTDVETVELLPAYAEYAGTDVDLLPVAPELTADVVVYGSGPGAESVQESSPEPPPVWSEPVRAIEIDAFREPVPAANQEPPGELELPAGMFDDATWARLLTLRNPLSGILFTIKLTKAEVTATAETAKKVKEIEDLTPALEKLMNSFVRGTDFGSRIGENEWVFVYSQDSSGFNQRRVGGISEKLWDFQLRHLGTSSVSFKWGAVEVQSEPLSDALEAARERMNQSPRRSKLPGSDHAGPRQVVNA